MELKNDYNLTVGLRIREIREALRMTREQFSEICDISDSFWLILSAEKSITIKTLNKICTGANVSADYIVFKNKTDFASDAIIEILRALPHDKLVSALVILNEYARAVKD